MSTSKKLKTKLFREGERSRQAINPEVQGYRCPMCWQEFSTEALESDLLTIDHVPQQSWAAQVRVLTCKECNNTFGHRYQPALSHLQDLAELRAGKPTKAHKVVASVEGKKFNARVYQDGGHLWIQGSKKNNPPEVARYWLGKTEQQIRPEAVQLFIQGEADNDAIERVLLRDAFLFAFSSLGYPYVCAAPMQDLRRVLHEEQAIPLGAVWSLPDPLPAVTPGSGEFIWVQEPKELVALLVPFDVPVVGRRHAILPFFPYPRQTYEELCTAWHQASAGNDPVEMSLLKAKVHPNAKFSAKLVPKPLSNSEVLLTPA